MDLKGKNVLLTGGSRGLGPVIAKALIDEGCHIAITARSQDSLNTVAESLRAGGATVVAVQADINNADNRKLLVDIVTQKLGQIDILVNNAGVETAGAYHKHTAEEIDLTITTNVASPMHLARMVLPGMLERGSGHIVNLGSLAGKQGSAYDAMYSGTKAAMIEWTRGLRSELQDTGVSASVVAPGYVSDVGMFASFGVKPPVLMGQSKPVAVAKAVVTAIKKDKFEILVNPLPVRPLLALDMLFPFVGPMFMRLAGVKKLQKEKVGEA